MGGHTDIKTLMMQDLSFLDIVARDENIQANFDVFPPTKDAAIKLLLPICPPGYPLNHMIHKLGYNR